jgi:putative peptidoglycan lipid II flippase
MMLACMAPCAAIFAALALPVIELLFVRGAFRQPDAENLASVFAIMLVGMVPMSTMGLAFKVFFAQNRVKVAGLLSVCGATVYFGLSALFPIMMGWKGIAAAYVVTWWLVFVIAFKLLGIFSASLVRFLFTLLLISTICWLSAKGLLAISKAADRQLGMIIQLFIAAAGASLVLAFCSLAWPGLDEGKFIARKVAEARRLLR